MRTDNVLYCCCSTSTTFWQLSLQMRHKLLDACWINVTFSSLRFAFFCNKRQLFALIGKRIVTGRRQRVARLCRVLSKHIRHVSVCSRLSFDSNMQSTQTHSHKHVQVNYFGVQSPFLAAVQSLSQTLEC